MRDDVVGTQPGLVYVVWELTLRCDLACKHCGSRAGKPRDNELTTDEALGVVKQLKEMGAHEITLIGGEAYLHEGWTEIARAIADAGMVASMTTGGRGITPDRAAMVRDCGIKSVSVSLDGIGATHDTQRGLKGSFESALAAIDNLRAAGVRVSVNTQINRLSFPELDAVLDLVIARGAHAWQVQLTAAMGRAADRPDWLMQPFEILDVIPKVAELTRRAAAAQVRVWPGNNIGYFGPHEATIRGSARAGGYATGCSAGRTAMGIEANGAIKGCPSLPTAAWVGGNVRDRTLRDIWDTTPELRYTRDRTVDDLWGYCRECYYADDCRAGCTWTSYVLFGRAGNNPYCHHRALEFQRRGMRERLVPAKRAPGTPFDHGQFELVVEPLDSTRTKTEVDENDACEVGSMPIVPAAHTHERRHLPILRS